MFLVEVSSLLLLCLSAAADQQNITVKPGDDATLQCHCPSDAAVMQLEWTRLEQKSDDYVFFYRNNRSFEHYQLPSFSGRVELRDPKMKDGDVSVTVKNVTVNDTGTYECKIISSKTENGERTTPKFSYHVSLTVTDSVHSDLHKLAEGEKDEGNNGGGHKDEGNTGGGNEDEGNTGGGNEDEGNTGGGNEDEGNTGGGNKDGRKSQKLVALAACLTAAGLLLIIVVVRYKSINKHTYVQTEKKEKDSGLHGTQTNHMSQCVDQWKCSAV